MATGNVTFGPFDFDRGSGALRRDGKPLPLGRRAAALLDALLEADGAVVAKDLLIERGWPGTIVEENNLAVQIRTLRRLLGRREDGAQWIVTAARAGYRLPREPGRVALSLPAIAVLPFVTMDEVGSFADGFVEDLITALSRFRTFAVVARTSTDGFRGTGEDARSVARKLGVRYLIEGSVRRDGRRVRLTAQLIDGESGVHLWAERLDGTIEDVFDFQDRLVERVVVVFEPQIRRAEIERARRKRPESLDAYDLYLRALGPLQGARTIRLEDYDEAIGLLERAIEIDPRFAPAVAMCAWTHEKRYTRGGTAPPGVDDRQEALALSARALDLDDSDAIVLMIAGALRLTLMGDAATALPLLRQAEALNPNSQLVATTAAYCFWHAGQIEESIASFSRVVMLNPWSPEAARPMEGLARAHLSAGHVEDALASALRALEATEGLNFAHGVAVAAYVQMGRQAEAEAQVRRMRAIWPDLTLQQLLGRDTAPKAQHMLLEQGLRIAGLPAA